MGKWGFLISMVVEMGGVRGWSQIRLQGRAMGGAGGANFRGWSQIRLQGEREEELGGKVSGAGAKYGSRGREGRINPRGMDGKDRCGRIDNGIR